MARAQTNAWSASVAAVLGALAVAATVLGPLAAHFGLLPPLAGFGLFALGLLAGPIVVLPVGLLALYRTRSRTGRSGRERGWTGTLLGTILLVLLLFLGGSTSDVPAIHDVTTSPDDAPAFRVAAENPANRGRDLSYPNGGPDVPDLQRDAYPDLAPLELSVPSGRALELVHEVATELGWGSITMDPGSGTLEATDTSPLFRFVDDVVVRVRPRDGGSVVDVRSTSRVGQSDLGKNAERIRTFLSLLARRAEET